MRVWGYGKNSHALQVDLAQYPEPTTEEEELYPYPSVSDVRALIRHALTVGWTPTASGGTFPLRYSPNLTLPGLAVVEDLPSDQSEGRRFDPRPLAT